MSKKDDLLEKKITDAIAKKDFSTIEENLKKIRNYKPKGFFLAISNASLVEVKDCYDKKLSLEKRFLGGTPLHFAINEYAELKANSKKRIELLKIIEFLIDVGADLSAEIPDGDNSLELSFAFSEPEVMQVISKKFDSNQFHKFIFNKVYGDLFDGIKGGRLEAFQQGMNLGVPIDIQNFKVTPLLHSLLELIDVSKSQKSSYVLRNREKRLVLENILEKKPNLKAELVCKTSVAQLMDLISDPIVKYMLINAGVKPKPYKLEEKAFIEALNSMDFDAVQLLISNGASLNFKHFGYTMLNWAVGMLPYSGGKGKYYGIDSIHKIIKLIIKSGGFDINDQYINGVSAYKLADLKNDEIIKSCLLEAGANKEVYDESTKKLFLAVSTLDFKVVKTLVDDGADLEAKVLGYTPLARIIETTVSTRKKDEKLLKKQLKTIKYLISKGADINARIDPYEESIFSLTNKNYEYEIQDLLISKGAVIPKVESPFFIN